MHSKPQEDDFYNNLQNQVASQLEMDLVPKFKKTKKKKLDPPA
jgi:hypothetical protein